MWKEGGWGEIGKNFNGDTPNMKFEYEILSNNVAERSAEEGLLHINQHIPEISLMIALLADCSIVASYCSW